MKKLFLFVALFVLCSLSVFATVLPEEKYATWCRDIQLDNVWRFDNAGAVDNNAINPDAGVSLEPCPGMLSFSILSWKDKNTFNDYELDYLALYLFDENYDDKKYQICRLEFSGDWWMVDNKEAIFKHEGNCTKITNFNNNKTWYVQKRMNSEYQGGWGAQFCYFVTKYNPSLLDFVNAAGNRLRLYIECQWDGGDGRKVHKEFTPLPFSANQTLTQPTISMDGWSGENDHTALNYSISQTTQEKELEMRTLLFNKKTGKSAVVQDWSNNAGGNFMAEPYHLGTVSQEMLESDGLYVTSQIRKTYPIVKTFYLDTSMPDEMTAYSDVAKEDAPTFNQPYNMQVINNGDGINVVKWSMKKKSASVCDNSKFVLERSKDPSFANIDLSKSVDYDSNKEEYEYSDSYNEREMGVMPFYYRLRRSNAAWGEPNCQKTYQTPTDYVSVKSIKTQQDGSQMRVSWVLSDQGIWTTGMKLELQYNNSESKKYSRSDEYTNISLSTCTPTEVTLSVTDNSMIKSSVSTMCTLIGDSVGAIHLTPTKGYYNDRVNLDWEVPLDSANFTYYSISRIDYRELGQSNSWTHLATINHTPGVTKYQYTDNSCTPGVYYQYRVEGYSVCSETVSINAKDEGIGFAQPYGVVTGQVTYNSNQGVEGVKIKAIGESVRKGRALYLATMDTTKVKNSYATGDSTHWEQKIKRDMSIWQGDIFENGGTFECWVKRKNSTLTPLFLNENMQLMLTAENVIKLRMLVKVNGVSSLRNIGQWKCECDFSKGYHHVSLSYNKPDPKIITYTNTYSRTSTQRITLYIDGQQITQEFPIDLSGVIQPSEYYGNFYLGANGTSSLLDGELDEVRIWNYELSEAFIKNLANQHLPDSVIRKYDFYLSYYFRRQPITIKDLAWRTQPSHTELASNDANQLFGTTQGCVELWINPNQMDKDQTILYQQDVINWKLTENQQLSVQLNNDNQTLLVNLNDSSIPWNSHQFNHIAFTYKKDSSLLLQMFVNGYLASQKWLFDNSGFNTLGTSPLLLGMDSTHFYNGYMDEIRFWNIYRDSAAINKTMNMYLSGNEYGLTGYYRCDDENTGELYDISKSNTTYHGRHMKMVNAHLDESNIPTDDQLALCALTDKNGNYILNAVPYSAEGSKYSLVPSLGVHEFSPSNTPIFFDRSASTHNAFNFTDQSSFEVSGYVYFENTDYPVEGCNLYVDGSACVMNNKIVTTDANGHFTISVPIGNHYITISKEGHTFAQEGRFPALVEGEPATYDFQNPMNNVNFTDQTLVTLTGRVAGGEVQGSLPHGFQVGTNNIGKARVVISPLAKGKYDLNLLKDSTRNWTAPTGCKVQSVATTGKPNSNPGRCITIETDSITGEFSVDLPPIDMSVDSITIPNNPDATMLLSPSMYGTIELSDCRESSWNKDSLMQEDSSFLYFSYLKKLDIIHRVRPTLSVVDQDQPNGLFGISHTTAYDRLLDSTYIIPLIEYDSTAADWNYVYGCPFFQQNNTYEFQIYCYEEYQNADNLDSIKVDRVPIKNSLVSIYNGAGESTSGSNQLTMDDQGKGVYQFQAGEPSLDESDKENPYRCSISIYYTDSKQQAHYNADLDKLSSCIVLGAVNVDGQNFITKGPDQVIYILRDPPGSNSSTTLKKGTIISTKENATLSEEIFKNKKVIISFGADVKTASGFGLFVISEMDVEDEVSIDTKFGIATTLKQSASYSYTLSRDISTNTEEDYTGASGDIYIGYSTNYNYGNVKSLGFERNNKADKFQLHVSEKTQIGKEYSTEFFLTQYQIENVQIPTMINQRNMLIDTVSQVEYDNYETQIKAHETEVIYISYLRPTDSNFGQEGYYHVIYPTNRVAINQVAFYNTQISNWKAVMAQNEKAKVDAIKYGKYKKHSNLSVDGGAKYTATSQIDTTKTLMSGLSDYFELSDETKFGFAYNGIGTSFEISVGGKISAEYEKGKETQESEAISYTLDLGAEEQLSVDVYEGVDAFSPIFYTSAGQTKCPYEGEYVSKYYQPGQHTLSAATQKMEDPDIEIDDNVATQIPIGGKAVYTVKLHNKSIVTTNTTLRLKQASNTNPHGAEIKVDGAPLTEAGIPMIIDPQSTIVKTITLSQSNIDSLNYDSIGIVWCSDCSPELTADTTYISAYFVPACPDVKLTLQKSVVNTQDPSLLLSVSGYDVNSPTLDHIRLEYKEASGQIYQQMDTIGKQSLKKNPRIITYRWDKYLSQLLDGDYDVRAVAVCKIGSETIVSEGEPITITKDMAPAESLGLPSPINGIYTNDNEISVTLNEPINIAKLKPTNIQVTGLLNAHPVAHEVAFRYTDAITASSEAKFNISSNNFALECYLNYNQPGYFWSHGKDGLAIGIDNNGHLVLKTEQKTIVSNITLTKGLWNYMLVSMQNLHEGMSKVCLNIAVEDKDYTCVDSLPTYTKDAPIYIGLSGEGMMHEMLMTANNRTWELAKAERNTSKETYSDAIGYWPMDEGRGSLIKDQLRQRHLTLNNECWWLGGDNKAQHVTSEYTVPLNTNVSNRNYALEMWVRMDEDGEIFRTNDRSIVVGVKNNTFTVMVDSQSVTLNPTVLMQAGAWHQLTLLGNRLGKSVFIIDGNRTEGYGVQSLPDLSEKTLKFGCNNPIDIDELRMWNGDMSESWLELYRYSQLGEDTAAYRGRLSYYESFNNVDKSVAAATAAPLRPSRQTESVNHNYVASTNTILINVTEPAYRIEGCTLEFCVDGLVDGNGNYSSPITWTAYVNRNQLLWAEKELHVIKENQQAYETLIDIVNNSGKVESWQITNLPDWLTLSATAGTIQPLAQIHLTATIDPSIAIGNYEQVVYLTGNQGLESPLYLHVQVTGNQPDWSIRPADFEYSMNMIGMVNLNGVALDDENDIVAAFIDDQIAGVASPVYYSVYDKFFVMMDIYANKADNQSISFKLWDASTGLVYTQLVTKLEGQEQVLHFTSDALLGTLLSPTVLEAGVKVEQKIALEKGWNWISFNVVDNNANANDFLTNWVDDISIIKSQSEFDLVDTVTHTLVGSLNAIDVCQSYRTKSDVTSDKVVVGYLADSKTTGILLGADRWNWIGFIPQRSLSVNVALANLRPAVGDIIKGHSGFATWDGFQWIGSLQSMTPGQGYMYRSVSQTDQTLYYPSDQALSYLAPERGTEAPMRHADSSSVFNPIDPGRYPNNMTITARVLDGEQVLTDVEVAVFAGEECRAAATANADLYFLTVPGEQATDLTFKVAVQGGIIKSTQTLTFTTDAVLGDLYHPYTIQIGQPSGFVNTSSSENGQEGAYKILDNNQVIIIRDGVQYDILGNRQTD